MMLSNLVCPRSRNLYGSILSPTISTSPVGRGVKFKEIGQSKKLGMLRNVKMSFKMPQTQL